MRRSVALAMITVLGCGTLGVAAPVAQSSPRAAPKLSQCWVGTWRDGHELEYTTFDGHKIRMHYSGGDIDHFHAAGVDKDNWKHSHNEHGKYAGSTVTETIRGVFTEHLHTISGHRFRVTSGHWSKSSTNTYTYEGHTYTGYLNAEQPFTAKYTCTAKKLKYYTKKGKLTGVESRISRKP